ncbi:MAG: MerC domain-containing protein [Saprospiraceae bacterium]|nr:MerC domain-containing protein [Saprospiraceae bacterium]
MVSIVQKSDTLGALASGLCLIHCLATPIIFIAQSCSSSCCSSAPLWWQLIDFIFLAISFCAIYWTAKKTSKTWLKRALWISWVLLLILLLNEKLAWIPLSKSSIYFPALGLVSLHIYNLRFCNCKEQKCCVSTLNHS